MPAANSKKNWEAETSNLERHFEWLKAAEAMLEREDNVNAELLQKVASYYEMASRQSENLNQFRELRKKSNETYARAAEFFEERHGRNNLAEAAKQRASAAYVNSWLAESAIDKAKTLEEAIRLGKLAQKDFEDLGDKLDCGVTCILLLECFLERLYLAKDSIEMTEFAEEGIGFADKAIRFLSEAGEPRVLMDAYSLAALQHWYSANVIENEEKCKELVRKSLSYSQEASKLASNVRDPYSIALSHWAGAICNLLFTEDVDSALTHAEQMSEEGKVVRDNFLLGVARYLQTFILQWKTLREDAPEKKEELDRKVMLFAEEAKHHLELVSQDFFIAETYLFYVESLSSLSRNFTLSAQDRQSMLAKALAIGRIGLMHATRSGSADAQGSTLHALSKALHFSANAESRADQKRALLEEALLKRKDYVRIVETAFPSNDWLGGVGKNYEGLIEADIANSESNQNNKKALLLDAVADMEASILRCDRSLYARPIPTRVAVVAGFRTGFARILNELYLLTRDGKSLDKSIKVFSEAAEEYENAGLQARAAEAHWNAAKNLGKLGKHHLAIESFGKAEKEYREAIQKKPSFAMFYGDYATYMKAWSEAERAKLAHDDQDFASAMKYYSNTAELLKSTKSWAYLSPSFFAWAMLEKAEDLSRKDENIEAIATFDEAAHLFEEARLTIEGELARITNEDERNKATELTSASVKRSDYCKARIHVEKARICDNSGEYAESSERYDSAADEFEKIQESLVSEDDKKEIQTIAFLCRGWQMITLAEVTGAGETYTEAADLFLKASEAAQKGKNVMLVLGNSAFCRAMQSGTSYEETASEGEFLRAKQFLATAANYYQKAGFDKAVSWTNAIGLLLDAHNYTMIAEQELDPQKKTNTLLLAEKCLEQSAVLCGRAGHEGKKVEVLKTLQKVKEKREFAISLGGLLIAPREASSTSGISAPNPTVEEPIGLQRFEGAFLQANLIAPKKDVAVGDLVNLEIQAANLGKNNAFLVAVEGIVPSDFELVEKPERSTRADGGLSLKGRRINALENEELKLTLRPSRKGSFRIAPKIAYLDETGDKKSYELDQVVINVREIGLRGWLKGPK